MTSVIIHFTRITRGIELFAEKADEMVVYLDGTYGIPNRTDESVKCSECHGDGRTISYPSWSHCFTCDGTGYVAAGQLETASHS